MSRNDEFINGHEHDSLHVIYTFQNMTCQLHVVLIFLNALFWSEEKDISLILHF